MATKWTKEQERAIYTRNCNLLVAAAAGSGKTAVLVERIIKMLTKGEDLASIDRLLVVTFTNAAASEMRERIGDAISKELEKDPSSEILQRQLSLLNHSNIMTMHSFCLNVIKNNYHLIDLDPGFRIADEAECSILKDDVVSELLEDKYEEGKQEYLDLVDAFANGNNDEKLKDEIEKLYRFVMSGPWPNKWLLEKAEEYNLKEASDIDKTLWSKVIIEGLQLEFSNFEYILSKAIETCDEVEWLAPYAVTLREDLQIVRNIVSEIDTGSISNVYRAMSLVKFSTIKRLKKGDVLDEALKDSIKDIRDDVKKKITALSESVPTDNLEEIFEGIKLMYPIVKCLGELVIEFRDRYSAKKREKNILDYNDIEHLCLKILVEKDGDEIKPSAVAKELKEKFIEVLVDEYQDSSNIQETIINMISRREEENPNVFMVGDVKQSIYKFRQAKPELFLSKYENYGENEEDTSKKIMLFKNFRSRAEILSSANFVFETLMSKTVGELEYDEKERLNLGFDYPAISEELMIEGTNVNEVYNSLETEIHILDKSGNDRPDEDDDSEEKEDEDLNDIEFEARIIANRIEELMSPKDGKSYVVWDKDLGKYRNLRYKDIVILLRSTKKWSEGILDELGAVGIPVYADTGTGYFDTTEIRTIMSLLNIIDNPMQDIYIIASLRSPIFSFTAEELGEIRLINKDKYFYENIEKICEEEGLVSSELREKCIYFKDRLTEWRAKAEYTPIDELIWYLYTDTAYYGYVGAMPNGPQRQANLKILFQRAKQYESTSFKGLFNFINFIKKIKKSSSNDMGSAKILGENEDVVRIMSIHKSKGLEFPVVFLSGTGKQVNLMDLKKNDVLYHDELGIGVDVVDVKRQQKYIGFPKTAIKNKAKIEALSEEMRILYVALTRPREKLIITGAVKGIEGKFLKWAEAARISEGNKINPAKLLASNTSYLDWIGMALAKHPDANEIRNGESGITLNVEDKSKWQVKTWYKSELLKDKKEDSCEEKESALANCEKEVSEEIKRRLKFRYKYIDICNVPSNISVSDLKRKNMDDSNIESLYSADEIEEFNKEDGEVIPKEDKAKEKLPMFMEEKKGITPAERGTIMHFVMLHVDFDKTSVKDIKDLLRDMVERELLREEEAAVVNAIGISMFFKSELGKRLLRAKENGYKIHRELPFFREIPAINLYDNLDKQLYKDETVRLQGIIDCFFEDEEGIVLLDYKTDFVLEGDEEKILERYRMQIDLYAETLEQILGKKIEDKYLYLFGLNKEVKY